jgi:uncharacterized membrane protein
MQTEEDAQLVNGKKFSNAQRDSMRAAAERRAKEQEKLAQEEQTAEEKAAAVCRFCFCFFVLFCVCSVLNCFDRSRLLWRTPPRLVFFLLIFFLFFGVDCLRRRPR